MAQAIEGKHVWKFYRMGGLDQVLLETGADLQHLRQLDQKLWVALSCPTKGLELDSRTLELLDLDKDSRVRAPEVLTALDWCAARLKDLGSLIPGGGALPLEALNDATPEGKALLGAARQILLHLGKKDATSLSAADVADTADVFAGTHFNGDGVVPPDSADAPEVQQVIADAVACTGGAPDRGGKQGIDRARLDAFFAECAAYADWRRLGEAPGVLALGPATAQGYEAVKTVRVKVDDYFNRCRLAAFDPRAGIAVNRTESELAALAAKDLSTLGDDLRGLPLSRVEAGASLRLGEGANPAWAGALAALQRDVLVPVFGEPRSALTPAEWESLPPRFAPYEQWLAAKKGASVERLGLARVQQILSGNSKAAIESLIEKDAALAPEAAAIGDAVRMAHYFRDLFTLLKNFVNFADFYDRRRSATFQAGKLFLDSRSCDLCIRVDDPAAHAALGSLSRMYIAYCDCKRQGEQPMRIAACFTQGDADYLMLGRNGIFYDRKGRDWDATIVKIVDNPISIRQAFFAPYKKFLRMIEEQVASFAAAKEKEADARLHTAATTTTGAATTGKADPPQPVDIGKMVGIIAALGVGAGAIGTVFGGLISGFMGLQPWWAKGFALLGVVLAISGPSMLLAWLKLRQRTLGPVLDANGWAVNGRVVVNIPLGTALTDIQSLPANSSRSLDDPFEDKAARKRRRMMYAALAVVALAAGALRFLHRWPFN
jgi:hypothetical protein